MLLLMHHKTITISHKSETARFEQAVVPHKAINKLIFNLKLHNQ